MKLNQFPGNAAIKLPSIRKTAVAAKQNKEEPVSVRKSKTAPISEEIMEYYRNLLKEYNRSGASNAIQEFRIL